MNKHPNKHIQAAIEYALQHGWEWVEAGSSSHAFCRLRCGNSVSDHQGHQRSVWSTPRVAEHHAQQIKRAVDQCPDSKKCSDSK
ncbi:MAG: hypothetical protein P4L95_23395 [Rouxiella aceris]|uniref:hypothetical protein n=1 Tax=Rouxiella aceris TaxID=2703884 RepID=UPI0028515082|nr:hypothetical protein [Rouxiella aceris]MDR3434811.1 hypothetical protein [Rouxiella aceris]